jgi:hypothetical protein
MKTALLLSVRDPQWDSWFERVAHDFYHNNAYHAYSEEMEGGRAHLAVVGDRDRFLVWPYIVRPLTGIAGVGEDRLCDATSVYGYAGPLVYGCDPGDDWVDKAFETLNDVWRSQRIVSVFTRLHPLLENHKWLRRASCHFLCAVELGGPTVSIDLALDEHARWTNYNATLRRHINRGRRLGLITQAEPDWRHLSAFATLYESTMHRNNAAPNFFFSIEQLLQLKRCLGRHGILMCSWLDNELVAAAICSSYGGIAQLIYAGVRDDRLDISPYKILLHDTCEWLRDQGNRVFHLGGGRTGNNDDSLLRFKLSFSRRTHPFYTGRIVVDHEVYETLCEQHSAYLRRTQCISAQPTFFPGYRAPAEPAQELERIGIG